MRITFEKDKSLSLIYIYLREFDGNIVLTIPSVRTQMFYDKDGNWLGFEVFNDLFDEDKFDFPLMPKPYIASNNEYVVVDKERIYVLFDKNFMIDRKSECACNIDFNMASGLQGMEFIIHNFDGEMNIVKRFLSKKDITYGKAIRGLL